jgi:hypothetical protein
MRRSIFLHPLYAFVLWTGTFLFLGGGGGGSGRFFASIHFSGFAALALSS